MQMRASREGAPDCLAVNLHVTFLAYLGSPRAMAISGLYLHAPASEGMWIPPHRRGPVVGTPDGGASGAHWKGVRAVTPANGDLSLGTPRAPRMYPLPPFPGTTRTSD